MEITQVQINSGPTSGGHCLADQSKILGFVWLSFIAEPESDSAAVAIWQGSAESLSLLQKPGCLP
jgi:hypothetical protein